MLFRSDRKSTRLNSSHLVISYAVFCLKKKKIAKVLKMKRRTVKVYFTRLFLRFGISDGIKRVKLATLLYRHQLTLEANAEGACGAATEEARGLHTGAIRTDPTETGNFPHPRLWNEAQQNDNGHD